MKQTNYIGKDAYFIRLNDQENMYLHPIKEGYQVNSGIVGAAIWTQSKAKMFIRKAKRENKIDNLEIVAAMPHKDYLVCISGCQSRLVAAAFLKLQFYDTYTLHCDSRSGMDRIG